MKEFVITDDFPKNEIEFDQRFSDELDCYDYLFCTKWPGGFICKKCGNQSHWLSSRALYICDKCEHQHSLTAGTIMHGTKKDLLRWFKAMWWFTTRKSGVNAINLKELLGLGSYGTAWTWLQKLRSCTIRNAREQLSGMVEVDEFYLGGRKSGKRGRGAEGKFPIVAAVEKNGCKLGRIRLQILDNCSSDELTPFVNQNVTKNSHVFTDGWSGYNALKAEGHDHIKVKEADAEDPSNLLPGVHMVASLVKRWIAGTFQGRFDKKHLQRSLDEFVFRFNRRTSKNIGKKFMRIVQQAATTPPILYKQIAQGIPVGYRYAN